MDRRRWVSTAVLAISGASCSLLFDIAPAEYENGDGGSAATPSDGSSSAGDVDAAGLGSPDVRAPDQDATATPDQDAAGTPVGVVACGSTSCATPALACCLVWQESDRCVSGATTTCTVPSNAATELARCDRAADCPAGSVCCGITDAAPHPFRSACALAADCAAAGGHEACQTGGACTAPMTCVPVPNSVYALCQ
jgi:hypothetical protein